MATSCANGGWRFLEEQTRRTGTSPAPAPSRDSGVCFSWRQRLIPQSWESPIVAAAGTAATANGYAGPSPRRQPAYRRQPEVLGTCLRTVITSCPTDLLGLGSWHHWASLLFCYTWGFSMRRIWPTGDRSLAPQANGRPLSEPIPKGLLTIAAGDNVLTLTVCLCYPSFEELINPCADLPQRLASKELTVVLLVTTCVRLVDHHH